MMNDKIKPCGLRLNMSGGWAMPRCRCPPTSVRSLQQIHRAAPARQSRPMVIASEHGNEPFKVASARNPALALRTC